MVQQLINAGADARPLSQDGWSLLHLAAQAGSAEIARLALPFCDIELRTFDGDTALALACNCSDSGFDELVDVLLDAGGKIDALGADGLAPLAVLAENGRFNALQKAVQRGVSVHYVSPHHGNLVFHAAISGNVEMVRWLIDKGVANDVAAKADDGDCGVTPLFVAAQAGHFEVMCVLADAGADLKHMDSEGSTPLTAALRNGRGQCARFLMRRGAKATRRDIEVSIDELDSLITLIAFGYPVDDALLNFVGTQSSFDVLQLAGVRIDQTTLPTRLFPYARLCGAIPTIYCPSGDNCSAQADDEDHFDRFVHDPADDLSYPARTHRLASDETATYVADAGLRAINDRAIEICFALQSFSLPALITLTVLDAACPLAFLLPMHIKWQLVTAVKHFMDRRASRNDE